MTDLAVKYLKKTVWASVILTLFIIFSGCGGESRQTVKNDRYRCNFTVYEDGKKKYSGTLTADEAITAEILSPETVKGMKIIRETGGGFQIEFCGEKIGSHKLRSCVSAAMCDIISGGKTSGRCGLGEFSAKTRPDRFISEIDFGETEFTVKFTNFEYI